MTKRSAFLILSLLGSTAAAAPQVRSCADAPIEIGQWLSQGKSVAVTSMGNGMLTKLPQNRLFGFSASFEGSCQNQGGHVECSGELLTSHNQEGIVFDQASAKNSKIRLEQGGRILIQKDSSFAAPSSQECFSNAQGHFIRSTYADALESRIVTFIFRKST